LKVGWKKLDNPIFTKIFGRRTLEMRLKQSRLAAMMFKILYRQKKILLSVVQTSVEVTESSLLSN
jgi:hypothetical protein